MTITKYFKYIPENLCCIIKVKVLDVDLDVIWTVLVFLLLFLCLVNCLSNVLYLLGSHKYLYETVESRNGLYTQGCMCAMHCVTGST